MDKKKVDMNNKEKAIELYFEDLTESEIKENNLELICGLDKNGRYYMFDDGTNPIFGKGHETEEEGWLETVTWLEERRR